MLGETGRKDFWNAEPQALAFHAGIVKRQVCQQNFGAMRDGGFWRVDCGLSSSAMTAQYCTRGSAGAGRSGSRTSAGLSVFI
jgi:hypothetical protein